MFKQPRSQHLWARSHHHPFYEPPGFHKEHSSERAKREAEDRAYIARVNRKVAQVRTRGGRILPALCP